MAMSDLRYASIPTIVPGLVLCAAVTLTAQLAEQVEISLLGGHWIESLVLAILIGVAVRSAVTLSDVFDPGIRFAAKTLLEVAVVLLGASLSVAALREAGFPLVAGIAALVALSLAFSFALGRLFGLSASLATLVACGNSICGNSAIAAAAPVIGAKPDDIAASIAFTALLGIGAVLVLLPGLLLLAASVAPTARLRPLAIWLGAISYPLYMLHYPVVRMVMGSLRRLDAPAWQYGLAIGVAMAGCLWLAWIALRRIDEPVRRWLTRRCAGEAATLAKVNA